MLSLLVWTLNPLESSAKRNSSLLWIALGRVFYHSSRKVANMSSSNNEQMPLSIHVVEIFDGGYKYISSRCRDQWLHTFMSYSYNYLSLLPLPTPWFPKQSWMLIGEEKHHSVHPDSYSLPVLAGLVHSYNQSEAPGCPNFKPPVLHWGMPGQGPPELMNTWIIVNLITFLLYYIQHENNGLTNHSTQSSLGATVLNGKGSYLIFF